MTIHPAIPHPPTQTGPDARLALRDLSAIVFGSVITLCVTGYQFGQGNQTVYLLEPLRLVHPELLANDWFTTGTLQYHAVFAWLAAGLMKLGIIRGAFLLCYLALVASWQLAWLRLVTAMGATRQTYVLSVVLYYLSAGGINLGVYQFLQDDCFLPSNVSNVAMLWGFYFYATDRRARAGACLGLAGLFHLNYAVVAIMAWGVLVGLDLLAAGTIRDARSKLLSRSMVVGSVLVLLPCVINIAMALEVKLRQSGTIPLDQFVQIYVRFRHTHHFDALAWPIGLWISFLWPIPLAFLAYRRAIGLPAAEVRRQVARVFLLMLVLQIIALLGAGIWFVSETLVQLIFWRFSIFVKLFSCIAAAYLICEARLLSRFSSRALLGVIAMTLSAIIFGLLAIQGHARADSLKLVIASLDAHRGAAALFAALCWVPFLATFRLPTPAPLAGALLLLLITALGWNRWIGLGMTPEQTDKNYLDVCHWARDHTPVDAVFIVPPSETAFRWEANRGIVVNYNHILQLSGEMLVWVRRLKDVLGVDDLVTSFPRDYMKTIAAIDARYESQPPDALAATADRYSARYVVVGHPWPDQWQRRLVFRSGKYSVYDLHDD